MPKGWMEETQISEEEAEKRRQEALEQYQAKVNALKQEELALKSSISDLKTTVEQANAARISELNTLEDSLKQRLSEVENLNIKAKELLATYEKNLADLAIEKSTFESYRVEKQGEINGGLDDIEAQKSALGLREESITNSEKEFSQKLEEHNKNVKMLSEQIALNEEERSKVKELKSQSEKELEELKSRKENSIKVLQDAVNAQAEYERKNEALEVERQQLALKKADYDEQIKRVNEEKKKMNDQALQLKADRIFVDRGTEDLKAKQNELTIQINKLNEMKAQLAV